MLDGSVKSPTSALRFTYRSLQRYNLSMSKVIDLPAVHVHSSKAFPQPLNLEIMIS
jgi:hypothetical protein